MEFEFKLKIFIQVRNKYVLLYCYYETRDGIGFEFKITLYNVVT